MRYDDQSPALAVMLNLLSLRAALPSSEAAITDRRCTHLVLPGQKSFRRHLAESCYQALPGSSGSCTGSSKRLARHAQPC